MSEIEDKDGFRQRYYAVKHKDDRIRSNSTSGGMFTAISDYVLDLGGTVYGAVFADGHRIYHIRAVSVEERDRMRGSKYVQSSLGDTFRQVKEDLGAGLMVLFTGTPCQADGLKRSLENIDTSGLILCDVVCFGVPGRQIWEDYVKYLEKKKRKTLKVHYFRTKVNGWHTVTPKNIFEDNTEDSESALSQIYMNLFNSGFVLLPSCYQCSYASIKRCSDLTLGDFWGIQNIDPDFDDNKGVSLVIVNSVKGERLLDAIRGELHIREYNKDDCLQHNLREPTPIPAGREQFLTDYRTRGFRYIAVKYAGYTMKNRIRQFLSRRIKHNKRYPYLRRKLRR